jgi:hypothetical protein
MFDHFQLLLRYLSCNVGIRASSRRIVGVDYSSGFSQLQHVSVACHEDRIDACYLGIVCKPGGHDRLTVPQQEVAMAMR